MAKHEEKNLFSNICQGLILNKKAVLLAISLDILHTSICTYNTFQEKNENMSAPPAAP